MSSCIQSVGARRDCQGACQKRPSESLDPQCIISAKDNFIKVFPMQGRGFEMRNRSLGVFFGLVILLCFSASVSAQVKETAAPAKATNSGRTPDLSGVWMRDAPPATAAQYWIYELNQDEPPMTAWGLEQFKGVKSSFGSHEYPLEETNDPVLRKCYPPGVPRVYMHPFPFQFIQTPDEVVMLFEVDSLRREIYTDGKAREPGLVPLWMRNSIGHWEGDTL